LSSLNLFSKVVPLIGIGACVSIQFAASSQAKSYFNGNDPNVRLTLPQIGLAGAAGGMANAFLSCPVELIRIRLQIRETKSEGPFDMIRNMQKRHGVLSLWKGFNITCLREVPGIIIQKITNSLFISFSGYGFYFLAYEWSVR